MILIYNEIEVGATMGICLEKEKEYGKSILF